MAEQQSPVGFLARRGFIRVSAALAAGLALPACRSGPDRPPSATRPRRTGYITPNDAFFLMSVEPHFRPPFGPHNVSGWSLEVFAADGRHHAYHYRELLGKARRTVMHTIACIGNPVGGGLIGNARWQVLPLKELLQPLRTSSARTVLFEGLDDYYSAVSLERALDDYAFVAMQMNAALLPPEHGFPARVLLPDLYGMRQPRWLRRIRLLEASESKSFWETRGWAGEVPVKTLSRIDDLPPARAGRAVDVTGMAFAGARGIRAVEISFDGGIRWVPCEMLTPSTAHVWSLWRYRWDTPSAGAHHLLVRATDSSGEVQTAIRQGRFPDGASGFDSLAVTL